MLILMSVDSSNDLDPDQDQTSVLIWSQTVCKGYQQMTKVAFNMINLNSLNACFLFIYFLPKIFQEHYQTLKQCVP